MPDFDSLLKILTFFLLLFGVVKLIRWVFGVDETLRLLAEISRKLGVVDPLPPAPSLWSRLKGRLRMSGVVQRGAARIGPVAVEAASKAASKRNDFGAEKRQ